MNTTCLIIDDEKLARELLREYLGGFPQIEIIGECAKGNEAVEKINKLKPDVIFLDVQMPGMNGFDVLEEIDHDPYVIFTTAYDKYAIQAIKNVAFDYLLKPIDENELLAVVIRYQNCKPQADLSSKIDQLL